ncbi:MAG: methylmalonyl-CoA mutase family protein, partial [Chloroflexota bacterium]
DRQLARLEELKKRRDNTAVSASLDRLKQAAAGTENVMPFIVACVEASATLEEVCDVLREVFGEQKQSYV